VAKTKVMIIDEQPYFRAGVRQTLTHEADFEIVEADPNSDLLAEIENVAPEVVLLGSDLAAQQGLELGGRIARTFPATRVIILSPHPNDEELFDAIRSSAVACLSKSTTPSELVGVIRRASHGEYPINETVTTRPAVARNVLRQFQDINQDENAILVPLTQRERQILTYVAEGNSNKQIANTLDISEQTIKNHVSAILRKLNANDRAHAVVLAIRRGWISLGEDK
jgi:two-component system response regulator DegU